MIALLFACAGDIQMGPPVFGFAPQLASVVADFVLQARNGVDAQAFATYNSPPVDDSLGLWDPSFSQSFVNPNGFRIVASIGSDGLLDQVRPYGTTGNVTIPSGGYVVQASGTMLPVLNGLAVNDELHVRSTALCSPLSASVPVLVIHDIGSSGTNLEAALQAIEQAGFNTITQAELVTFLDGPSDCDPLLPSNPIVITFDDAYASQFAYAPALLEAYGMVGIFFVITGWPGDINHPGVAEWSDIADAVAKYPDAVELGCHSHLAHTMVNGDGKYLSMTETQREDDLETCRYVLEKHTGIVPTAIAWPYGAYDEELVDLAREAGFETMWTTWPGLNVPENDDAMGHVRRFGLNVNTGWAATETAMDRWVVCP